MKTKPRCAAFVLSAFQPDGTLMTLIYDRRLSQIFFIREYPRCAASVLSAFQPDGTRMTLINDR